MNKRGALFFTLDTLLAGLILAFTIVLMLSLDIQEPIVQDTKRYLDNFVDYITIASMSEVGNTVYPYNVQTEGVFDLKVHENIHKLYYVDLNETKTQDLIRAAVANFVPEGRGISYTINNDTIFIDDQNVINPTVHLSFSIITYYRYNDEIFGPNITQVSIWN
jgi:hypothetical protein